MNEYTFRCDHPQHGKIVVVLKAESKSDAKRRIAGVLHVSWRVYEIRLTAEAPQAVGA